MKLYIAGPMRGYPRYNFPAFFEAARELEAAGHETFNPAQNSIDHLGYDPSERNPSGVEDGADAETIRELLLNDLTFICRQSEGIVLLPGAISSTGARAEHFTALAINVPSRPCRVYELFNARDRISLGLRPLALCECP